MLWVSVIPQLEVSGGLLDVTPGVVVPIPEVLYNCLEAESTGSLALEECRNLEGVLMQQDPINVPPDPHSLSNLPFQFFLTEHHDVVSQSVDEIRSDVLSIAGTLVHLLYGGSISSIGILFSLFLPPQPAPTCPCPTASEVIPFPSRSRLTLVL